MPFQSEKNTFPEHCKGLAISHRCDNNTVIFHQNTILSDEMSSAERPMRQILIYTVDQE